MIENVPDLTALRAMEDFAKTIIPASFAKPEIKMGVCTDVRYRSTHLKVGTATVTLGGADLPIAGVRWLKGAQPTVGSTVVLLKSGPDYFIIGVVADANNGKQWMTQRAIGGTFGTTPAAISWTYISGTPGLIQFGAPTIIVLRSGNYRMTVDVTVQGAGANWFIVEPRQIRSAVTLIAPSVVGQCSAASKFDEASSTFIYECLAGDVFQVFVSAEAAGQSMDGRSNLVIEEV